MVGHDYAEGGIQDWAVKALPFINVRCSSEGKKGNHLDFLHYSLYCII